ncbi:MAG: hypothetical protein EHM86_07185, partial [Desulfobulbaceae bacterium]
MIDTTQTSAEEVGIALRIDIHKRLLRQMWQAYQEQQEKIQELLKGATLMKTGLEFPQPIQHPIFHCDNCNFDFALLNVSPVEDERVCELTRIGEHTDGSWYCPHCGC